LDSICLTKIDVSTSNGRLNKDSIVCHKLINQKLITCPHDPQDEKMKHTLSVGACHAYNLFIEKYPNIHASIFVKLSCFIKRHHGAGVATPNTSYIQIDIQYIQGNNRLTENYYVDISDEFSNCIFNTLCDIRNSIQIDKSSFSPQYLNGKIIFCNKAAAILTHEFSHLFEADIYLYSRNYLKKLNPYIGLTDLFRHPALPTICLDIDDEFSPNHDVAIIEHGVVKNIMVDEKWSQIFHTDLYGNGRMTFQENAPVLPRMRISHMKYQIKCPTDKMLSEMNDYLIFENIKSGKLISKDGIAIFQIENAQYYHSGEVIQLEPFSIHCPIIEIINNITCVTDSNYYTTYPCGKSGYQVPCGVITPSSILSKGDKVYAL